MKALSCQPSSSVPQKKSDPDIGLAAGQASAGIGRRRARHADRRVLIVEDEAMIAGLIESILGKGGWSVVGPVATVERRSTASDWTPRYSTSASTAVTSMPWRTF